MGRDVSMAELLDEHCYITCTDHPSLLVATLHRKGRKHQQGAGISWGDVFMDMIPRDRRDAEPARRGGEAAAGAHPAWHG